MCRRGALFRCCACVCVVGEVGDMGCGMRDVVVMQIAGVFVQDRTGVSSART